MKRKALVCVVLSVVSVALAPFSHFYESRSTGLLPVITYPLRSYTIPFAIAGAVLAACGIFIQTNKRKQMVFKFLMVFLSLGFVTKILGEVIHELVGHGLFVLLFRGRITDLDISLLWPYKLSGIGFAPPPSGFQPWKGALVIGGGILMCLITSFVLQAILVRSSSKRVNWVVSAGLFWLAFWTFINPAGYLVVGGIEPFGDVAGLISAAVMTRELALIVGLLIFLVSLFSLSLILRNVLAKAGVNEDARWSIVLFWLVVPLLTFFSVLGLGQPLLIALLGFVPVLAACAGLPLHNAIVSRRKSRETRA